MKKYLFIIVVFFIVIYLVYVILSVLVGKKRIPTTNLTTPTPTQINYPRPSGTLPNTKGKIIIDGVEANDFRASSKKINDNGDLALSENQNYTVQYFPLFGSFLISITSSSFEKTRIEAEQDFLNKLGIIEKEACKLKVNIAASGRTNPYLAGRYFPLSFCQQKNY